ncbi:hypothetical protein LCGC14_0142070 [marine sediment metagenome]|uniref:Uncharacterized protein n=1 Tax=marine sediment metagenome TaxID=412755 RepID=A0A0F9VGK3_9ZZZZ
MENKTETVNDQTLAFEVTKKTPVVRFLASLSDGRTVIQDDRKENIRHAWARLADWLKVNPGISITEMRLQGPNGVDIKMPPNQKGYFFGNKHRGVWNGPQYNDCGIGYYDGQKVNVSWYRQPKFDQAFAEEKTVIEAGFFLIKNT